MTALLEYLDLFMELYNLQIFLLLKLHNASIILDSCTYLLCAKLCWHYCPIPTNNSCLVIKHQVTQGRNHKCTNINPSAVPNTL